jgi:hypothetical protein
MCQHCSHEEHGWTRLLEYDDTYSTAGDAKSDTDSSDNESTDNE